MKIASTLLASFLAAASFSSFSADLTTFNESMMSFSASSDLGDLTGYLGSATTGSVAIVNDSIAMISQTGDTNVAFIQSTGVNKAGIVQYSADNVAGIVQTGASNVAAIYQK